MKRLSVLYSFAKPTAGQIIEKAIAVSEGRCELDIFVDSGAYSAFTLGLNLSIDDYIAFIYKYRKIITCYANLDIIDDQLKTIEHQDIMEECGLSPIPVFQYRAPFWFAEELAERYDHVAISGPSDMSLTAYHMFASSAILKMRQKNPNIKIHGFGVTRPAFLEDLEFTSVDSSSWNVGRYGSAWLYNPKRDLMRMFQRICSPTMAEKYKLFSETLEYYGLTPNDFVKREKTEKYSWATIKAFHHFAALVGRRRNRELRMYFAGLEPVTLQKKGLIEYILADLDGSAEHLGYFYGVVVNSKKHAKIKNRKWERKVAR